MIEASDRHLCDGISNSKPIELAPISTPVSNIPSLPCNESLPDSLPAKQPGYYILNSSEYSYYGSMEEKFPPDGQVTQLFRSGNEYNGEFKAGKA